MATDLSDQALPAVRAATTEARRRFAQVEFIRALGALETEAIYLVGPGMPGAGVTPFVWDLVRRRMVERVAFLGVKANCKVVDRPAAAAVVREAKEIGADLVVVAPGVRSGLMGLRERRVSAAIVRLAPCSVLVVKTLPKERGLQIPAA
jgi:nucleotide-binding universal stress UspA family protein